jgi:hypothetical protein
MSFAVVEVKEFYTPGTPKVQTFGPFATAMEAEQARRRRHFDNILASGWNPPKTYVAEIEAAR